MNTIRAMWAGLTPTGRTVLIGGVVLLLVVAMLTGTDIGPWLAALLAG